mgnify:CR=1 FL=1
MIKLRFIFSLGIILILTISSCNLARGTPPDDSGAQPTGDPVADQQTLVALAVQQTQTAAAPVVPEFTFTPSLTSTITLTTTPEVPRVTVSQSTNCRTGPGEPYDIVGTLPVGTPAEVVGRNQFGDTWIIKLPSNPSVTCWLWGYWASVEGNTAGLTVYTPPPTPTPAGNFTFGYAGWGVGPGYECFQFSVTNNGGMTWESYFLSLKNLTDGGAWSATSDIFTSVDMWCGITGSQLNLDPGEFGSAVVNTFLLSNPAGDLFEAILTLCTGNGQTGYCRTDTYNFTP